MFCWNVIKTVRILRLLCWKTGTMLFGFSFLYFFISLSFSDDPSVTVELTRPGPVADHPRPPMVAQGRNRQEEQDSSEIDTDDEIAAVQQVNIVLQIKTRHALQTFWSYYIRGHKTKLNNPSTWKLYYHVWYDDHLPLQTPQYPRSGFAKGLFPRNVFQSESIITIITYKV